MISANRYDELPYKSFPIEWTAPERLVLTSMLHGGPRSPLDHYRVLELGCGNGANLLPLAYYRREATVVGLDGAANQIELAKARGSALGLSNIEFIHADFLSAAEQLSDKFDYILAHGVFSWVPHDVRDALLAVFTNHLRPGGLLYLNYNTRPGWDIRGLVRDFLLAQTSVGEHSTRISLRARATFAQEVAAKMVAALTGVEHHYSKLLANEFQFVCEGDVSWVGHEFLSPDNHPYWRSEFLKLVQSHDLHYVADADFNYSSGRIPEDLVPRLDVAQITGRCLDDTVDLLCYRQLHSPLLTRGPWQSTPLSRAEFDKLIVASRLEPCSPNAADANPMFKHPSGYQVEAKEQCMHDALLKLRSLWPRGMTVWEAFSGEPQVEEDLRLLYRNGLIELRCIEPGDFDVDAELLNQHELRWGGYYTTPYHTTVVPAPG